ncbi:alpha-mannosidase [Diaminobutyricibacter tongyongensis]|uniref:Alpha-mannosidase n=1 Tax=Leifsonia tongyongensis TaxID=1268043 RepID=A0A6L9XVN9_9MICO|nr:glycoside hydrolase family 38 C-terminal domain-containing protein [Diaminobutyricibacter tongyongensis]NEN05500.1 alpha-mannosidase [Diaminobutyricibacter tongyongensis]
MTGQDSSRIVEQRVERLVRERLAPAVERARASVTVEAWEVPDEPVPFAQAVGNPFAPFSIGQAWGRPWGTVWFRVTGTVPADWAASGDVELVVDLGFTGAQAGFQAEGLVYASDGSILKAIEPLNGYVRLAAAPGEDVEVFIEAAANPDIGHGFVEFRPTPFGRKATAPADPLYALRRIELVQRDGEVWELIQDAWTLQGLASQLAPTSPRRAQVFAALEAMADAVDPFDVSATASQGRAALRAALEAPAAASAHRVFAVGHAHIDSAWLWPVRETIRKVARTFSNVLDLMDQDPDFVFAASSAQQYAWMKRFYPELFERIRVRVAEGRFVPVGGMWVESDTNLVGAEALARQFVEGTRFFVEEFGVHPREVWLPDTFGYTAALPQIARAAGAENFLSQKISWNETNRFPHHTFLWEGIDGSRIFAHFPPVDTYNAMLSGAELAHAEQNFADKGRANTSLVPFGFGDGGGGPTREMVAAAHRTRSLEGSPTVRMASPAEFFDVARAELADPSVWAGELYLELHRGTYTSQARTKRGNRRSEALLHEAELWCATAAIRLGRPYPYADLRDAWQTVLLQQFHDILPGSSIGWVHDQAVENYRIVGEKLERLIGEAVGALAEAGGVPGAGDESGAGAAEPGAGHVPQAGAGIVFNASPLPVDGVPAFGAGPRATGGRARVEQTSGGLVLANDRLRVGIDSDGLIDSLVDVASGREVVPTGERANLLQLFRDTPRNWDAWDIDLDYRRTGEPITGVDALEVMEFEVTEETDERVAVRITRSFGASTVTQTIALSARSAALDLTTDVDWHERQRMLKLAFPVDVHTASAASEIQFGHIVRPTHTNTSWDAARFETSAHRWVHVADAGFGIAVANDSTYGHDITRHERAGGGTYSVVRQTLLRAPLFPDPEADQGMHTLRSSLVVGGVGEAIEEGYRLNLPLRAVAGPASAIEPIVSSDNPAVVIETVKLAEDRSGDVVVRLYESHGARASAGLVIRFPFAVVVETDLHEQEVAPSAVAGATAGSPARVPLELRPFQLVTLRFARS